MEEIKIGFPVEDGLRVDEILISYRVVNGDGNVSPMSHPVTLIPVPEPSTMLVWGALMLAGLARVHPKRPAQ